MKRLLLSLCALSLTAAMMVGCSTGAGSTSSADPAGSGASSSAPQGVGSTGW